MTETADGATPSTKGIAVCVSGRGTNLFALLRSERRGLLGGAIRLVLADRPCPAVEFAAAQGIATSVVQPSAYSDRDAWDGAVAAEFERSAVDLIVLAGFMRVLGPATVAAFRGRILNVHPSLLPAFPGRDAISDALVAGVRVTGVTIHLVDETLDGGPIVAQEVVEVVPGDAFDSLAARIHAVEHRLLPRCVALALAGAVSVEGREVRIDTGIAATIPTARRALVSVSDKTGLVELGRGLTDLGFEIVSTGGTARTLREAGLDVVDVATVTGFPEMLDGRVKTLHPRIAAGVLADLRRDDHRGRLAMAGIEPFELVVVNLYPFAQAARRPDVTPDELIEEIDIGGPTLVRAAAKNHASVAIVTDPADYGRILERLREDGRISDDLRRELALRAFAHTADYDAMIAATLPGVLAAAAGAAGAAIGDRFPTRLSISLERVETLRYGENPHQAAALYRRPGTDVAAGPFASVTRSLQGKPLSYNNILDASAATALVRDLRGAAIAIIKHTNPCGVAEADDLLSAWDLALSGDPVSAYGGVVAIRGAVDGTLAARLAAIFLEVIVASAFDDDARSVLSAKANLRLLEYSEILVAPTDAIDLRSAGGGVLATDADRLSDADEPASWTLATSRAPTAAETTDLSLAWRVARHVTSNAIVLVRGRAVVGVGSGQMSRVDSARHAVEKAGPERAAGAVCASDAFFPFPDGVETCLAGGVGAFVQPGGSQRDPDVIAAVERASGTMLLTGRRHFRH